MSDKPEIDSRNDLLKDEDTLVRQSQENPGAFGPLFDFYAPLVYRYVLHRIGDVSDAEDVTSRIFTDALQSLIRYRPKRHGSFGGWLFTIARRRCADHFRVSNPLPLSDSDIKENVPGPLDRVISRDEHGRLKEILNSLNDNDRELLQLRFAAELTYQQIGDVIGKSEGAAKMRVGRLLKRMKIIWEEKDGISK